MSDNKKLRTSQDVYHRIRWDAQFDPSQFVIGYETRDNGMSEIALEEFDPNGDIPWHRIWYFRDQSSVRWDRKTRLDLIFHSGEQGPPLVVLPKKNKEVQAAAIQEKPELQLSSPREVYHHQKQWSAVTEKSREKRLKSNPSPLEEGGPLQRNGRRGSTLGQSEAPRSGGRGLRVVTYNLLSGPDEAENIGLPLRMKGLCAILEESLADLIAVQEVNAGWREHLLSQKFLQQHYETTLSPADERFTLALFSKHPITRAVEYRYNQGKQFLLCELETESGPLVVVLLHLTSDKQLKSQEKRAAQWQWIQNEMIRANEAIQNGARVIILGDFNATEIEVASWQPSFGGIDLWREMFPLEEGLTFDASMNDLARLTSATGKKGRLDRILTRGFRVENVQLLGTKALGYEKSIAIYPSDHYGLMGDICMTENDTTGNNPIDWQREQPSYKSSLLVVPPASTWEGIQQVRQQYDPSFQRWMPHINMVYGFVSEGIFAAAAARLQEALQDEQAFTVTMTRVKTFGHAGSTTVFISPDDESKARLTALQKKVEALFPSCNEQGQKSPQGFTPHLTIAKLKKGNANAVTTMQAEWQEKLLPISFSLEGLYLISRREDQPFEVRHFVPFGGGKRLPEKHQKAFELVQDVCEAVLVKHKPLYVTGSAQFGTLSETSDLDLLCVGPESTSHEELFAEAKELLEQSPGVTEVRSVEEAMVPVLKAKVDGLSVDLTYARVKEGDRAPQYATPLDDISKISLAGYLEIEEIIKVTQRKFAEVEHQELLRWVAKWAKSRQVYGNRLGFLGGFSWAVLVAAFLQKRQRFASFDAMAQGFLQEYAEWSWPTPVCLSDAVRERYTKHDKEPMPILTPLVPARNSARNVCRSTLQVLQHELQRAAHLVKSESLESALQPLSFDVSKKHISLSLDNSDNETEGFVESRLVGLYVMLEALQVEVRPFFAIHEGARTTWRIQLSGSLSEDQAEQVTQRFSGSIKSHLPDAKLTFQTLYAL